MWCIVVNMKRTNGNGMEMRTANTVRASISFPPELYRRLEEIARRKKVSLAWVMRDAGELYAAHRDVEGSGSRQDIKLSGE
jgi:predicted transcriptional regulator